MQILLASAKTMNNAAPVVWNGRSSVPKFKDIAQRLAHDLSDYDAEELSRVLSCSLPIATQNKERYRRFSEAGNGIPAVLAYNGQAYKHLKAADFSDKDVSFVQQHLWITSFLYGILRPCDTIRPYRLEGKIELPTTEGKSLFHFWKERLTDLLIASIKKDDGILLHLATEEFQHLFDWPRLRREVRIIQPLFYIHHRGTYKIQAVWAKTCRGAMTRFAIKNRIVSPTLLQAFDYEGFRFAPNMGEADFPHFVREDDV